MRNIELNRRQRFFHNLLVSALEADDMAAVRNLVDHIHEVPDYILLSTIGRNMVNPISILAPKCAPDTITRGLNRMIMGNAYINMPMVYAIVPYATNLTQVMANACAMGRNELVEYLHPMCDPQQVLERLERDDTGNVEHLVFWKNTLRERINAEKLRETLTREVSSTTQASARKM